MNEELKQLINLLKTSNVTSVEQGIQLIDRHFETILFSLAKLEWVTRMTTAEKKAFVRKALKSK